MNVAVITPEEMYRAEQAVFDTGVSSFSVMQVAGEAVGRRVHETYPSGTVRVLCGPGGNGGDGFVAAAYLANLGRQVRVYTLSDVAHLSGDVEQAAALWSGQCLPLDDAISANADITIDALFGGGLSRPLTGTAAQLANTVHGRVVSVDVPSGLDGLTARPLGPCFTADVTVTFAAYRPAHVLSPGAAYCGLVHVAEIGVPVPDKTWVQSGSPNLPRATFIFDAEQGLTRYIGNENPGPANRIEAIRRIAAGLNRPVFLRTPDPILARPNGQVTLYRID